MTLSGTPKAVRPANPRATSVCEGSHGTTSRSRQQKDRQTTLDYQALKERGIPWSRVHLSRLEAARKFPLHVDIGANSVGWFEDEVDDFLEMKAAERDAKAQALVDLAEDEVAAQVTERKLTPLETRPPHLRAKRRATEAQSDHGEADKK